MTPLSRRDFLQLSGATLAGLSLRSPTSLFPPSASRLRFGYAAITWNGKDAQAIEEIEAVGFPGIQLRSGILAEYQSKPAALRDLLAKHRLSLVALSSGAVSVDPALRAKTIDEHVAHARFLREAGGRFLQLTDERPKGRAVTQADIARLAIVLSAIASRVEDMGVSVGYHNHMGTIGESAEAVDQILTASSANVKLLLDVAHYHQGGGDPVAAIGKYWDRLLMLHIKDVESPVPGGKPGSYRFVELGKGRVDLKGVFRALSNYDGWAVVELDSVPDSRTPKEAAVANKRYLERLGMTVKRG